MNELINESLILNFMAYLLGSGIVLTIVMHGTVDNEALKAIALFLPCFIAIIQLILIFTKVLKDTAKELIADYMDEQIQTELNLIYPHLERRLDEFEILKYMVSELRYTQPTYLELFQAQYIRSTIIGLTLITLRVLLGFVVIRLVISIILANLFIDVIYISLNIAGAYLAFFFINSILLYYLEYGKRKLLFLGSLTISVIFIVSFIINMFTNIFRMGEQYRTEQYIGAVFAGIAIFIYGVSSSPLTFVYITESLPERGLALSMVWYCCVRCVLYVTFLDVRYHSSMGLDDIYVIYQIIFIIASVAVLLYIYIVNFLGLEVCC